MLFWIYFCLLNLVFVLQWISLHFFIVIASVLFDFPSNSEWNRPFHRSAFDYSPVDSDGLCNYWRDVPWKNIFNLGASAVRILAWVRCRFWQIACKRRYAYTKISIQYWFLYVKIIWICQCIRLFSCIVLVCLLLSFIVLSWSLPRCAALFFVYTEADFVAQP